MAKGGFFNSYFYGKSGKKDYTEADLPNTRFELFRTVLSVRKGSMVGLNLLYFIFWIPALFWSFLNLLQLGISESLTMSSLLYSWLIVLFPLIALTGPFNMGISHVMRAWARDEHSFVWSDFWAGVKANWKQGLLFGLLNGFMPLIAWLCLNFYSQMLAHSVMFYLPLAAVFAAYILWNMCALILPTILLSYELRFFTALKNAFLMSLATLPKTFGALLATLSMPVILLIAFLFFPSALSWLSGVAVLFYLLFGLSLNKLIAASYANMLCEKYLNTRIDGARVNIGLRTVTETKIED